MSKPVATPGQVVELPKSATTDLNQKTVLIKTGEVQTTHLIIPAGSTVPTYEAAGQIILHCLEGRISMTARGETQELRAGQLLYLRLNEAFSMFAIEQASVLATVIVLKQGTAVELIGDQ